MFDYKLVTDVTEQRKKLTQQEMTSTDTEVVGDRSDDKS